MTHNKYKNILITVSITIILVLAIYLIRKPEQVEVQLSKVERGSVESIVTNTRAGTVKACRQAELSPATGGQIATLPVSKGQNVNQGDILIELWNDDLQARLSLAQREAVASKARAEEACTIAEVARKESKRMVELHRKGLASQEQKERAVGEAQAKKSSCDAANAISQQSKAQIDVAQAMLEQTRLRAPFSGKVVEINGEVGEFITPSPVGIQTLPAVVLIDEKCMYVTAPIDEVDARRIQQGMPARISLDAFDNISFEGKVSRVGVYVLDVEKQARTVDIDVAFSEEDKKYNLLPGYSADVEIIVKKKDNQLRIPSEALLHDDYVYLYKDGYINKVKIKPGLTNWKYTAIESGLNENDQIVRNTDAEGLDDGVKVKTSSSKK